MEQRRGTTPRRRSDARPPGRSALEILALSILASCGSKPTAEVPVTETPAAPVATEAGAPPVELDDSKPIPLEAWRKLDDEGKAAIREQDPAKRVEKCRAFVVAHADHEGVAPVLDALVAALVEEGSFDPAELSALVERRAAVEVDSFTKPYELVRDVHVKHKLPLESGLRLLSQSRERADKEWQEVELQPDPRTKQWLESRLHRHDVMTRVMEGRLYLEHGKHEDAMRAFDRAEESAKKYVRDVVVTDASGAALRTLPAGGLDELYLLRAVTQSRAGDVDAAKSSMKRVVGFVDDTRLRTLYGETRDTLGLRAAAETVVTAAASPAQTFKLQDLSGKAVDLAKLRGKTVVIAFWASWCGPCKKELPVLQKFARAHKRDVELLTINIDDFASRSKVKPFLQENDLDVRVLLEDPQQLSSYDYAAIPALYVVDREGRIAHARTGYDPDLEAKLSHEILEIVQAKRDSGRTLFTIEQAPSGMAVRFQTAVVGDAAALAIAPPVGSSAGEIGVVGREGLMRWSSAGVAQAAAPIAGWTMSLHAADLDSDGRREWIVGGYPGLKVLDAQGKQYWERGGNEPMQVAGIADLDGDGFAEIVGQAGDRVSAMKTVPEPLWRSRPFERLESVELAGGAVLAQAAGLVVELDGKGNARGKAKKAPEGRTLAGRIPGAEPRDLYKGLWDPDPILGHDIDGDGKLDVVLASDDGVVAYDEKGDAILRIRSHDLSMSAAVGDLDGKPGAEIALFVQHYGLVVLGRDG